MIHLTWADAHHLCVAALTPLGYATADAAVVADHLLAAEAAGMEALGLRRVTWIAEILAAGAPRGDVSEVVSARGGCVLVDGHGGIGYLAATRAMSAAADLAKASGVGVAAVRNVFLTGSLRVYGNELAHQGLASIITSSAAPAIVAPTPGGRRVLGTNPIAIAVPGNPYPLIFDSSVTPLAYSELVRRAAIGESLPAGCGLDQAGRPTTDAAAVLDDGAMLAWAGHRGFGLAAAVQALAMLVGAPPVATGLADCAMFLVVIDPQWLDPARSLPAIGDLAELVNRAAGPADARLPGQRFAETQRAARTHGLWIEPATVANLRALAGMECEVRTGVRRRP
jgi:LDH2 family malate/lactate/ureidoglycolate dehydrogenase